MRQRFPYYHRIEGANPNSESKRVSNLKWQPDVVDRSWASPDRMRWRRPGLNCSEPETSIPTRTVSVCSGLSRVEVIDIALEVYS